MDKIVLSDIYKGDYPITQYFGANPEYYKQFGLKAHEGIDIGCPNGTELISPFSQSIVVRADDYGNYGKHIVLWDDKQLAAVWYCHCQKLLRNVGEVVMRGTTIALSDNTGNTTGPHLHFSVCRTDENGVRISQDNGYIGMLDPLKVVDWQLEEGDPPEDPDALGECLTAHGKLMDAVRERDKKIKELNEEIVKVEKERTDFEQKADLWNKTSKAHSVKSFVELDTLIHNLKSSTDCDEVIERMKKQCVKDKEKIKNDYQESMNNLRKLIIDPNKLTKVELIKLLLGIKLKNYEQNE